MLIMQVYIDAARKKLGLTARKGSEGGLALSVAKVKTQVTKLGTAMNAAAVAALPARKAGKTSKSGRNCRPAVRHAVDFDSGADFDSDCGEQPIQPRRSSSYAPTDDNTPSSAAGTPHVQTHGKLHMVDMPGSDTRPRVRATLQQQAHQTPAYSHAHLLPQSAASTGKVASGTNSMEEFEAAVDRVITGAQPQPPADGVDDAAHEKRMQTDRPRVSKPQQSDQQIEQAAQALGVSVDEMRQILQPKQAAGHMLPPAPRATSASMPNAHTLASNSQLARGASKAVPKLPAGVSGTDQHARKYKSAAAALQLGTAAQAAAQNLPGASRAKVSTSAQRADKSAAVRAAECGTTTPAASKSSTGKAAARGTAGTQDMAHAPAAAAVRDDGAPLPRSQPLLFYDEQVRC